MVAPAARWCCAGVTACLFSISPPLPTKCKRMPLPSAPSLKSSRTSRAQVRHVSDKKSNAFAPALFAEHPDAKGLSTARLNAAMQRLFAANRIHNEISGPPSKQRERIVMGPPPAAAGETDGPPPAPAEETE